MAEILNFRGDREEPDIYSMDETALRALLEDLREQIAQLDEAEPADMDSEEYEVWGEAHEELEDLLDEVMDRLELL